MDIELVTTGSELLNGRTVNRHASTVGDAIAPLGLNLSRDTTVPDGLEPIMDAVRSALGRARIVLVSGGLGPTSDDLTRDAVGRIVGQGQRMDAEALQRIRDRYTRSNRPLTPMVERHALVLEGADVLQNPEGLAPGERITWNHKTIFLLPGPPREFNALLTQAVVPWLAANAAQTPPLVKIFQVCGIGESDIVTRLEGTGFPGEGIDVAYCARLGQVEVRLSADPSRRDAIESTATVFRTTIGANIIAEERVNLEDVVAKLLVGAKATIALAESCTGGLVGHRLTSVAGSSAYMLGGVIAYAYASKVRDLGVKQSTLDAHGAVSKETACEMAVGVRARFGSTYGLAVTGIAGPGGGTPEKPVGLVHFAVADDEGVAHLERRFAGTRAAVKEWASQIALDHLRRRLLGIA